MSENMNITGSVDLPESEEMERRLGAIRTALFLLAFSQVLPLLHYFWQAYCC